MADHSDRVMAPDYPLDSTLQIDQPAQYRALFDGTRERIVQLLLERAATIKELADTLDRPKGTIGHHVSVLEQAGLIRVVRTRMVRAIEAKYYGRTARTYQIGDSAGTGVDLAPAHFLTEAAAEFATVATQDDPAWFSTLRHVRIPERRAAQWARRLNELVEEFTAEERAGETTYGLLVAMYPTDRPHLPDREGE